MKMENRCPKLSICIPTFNQPSAVKILLEEVSLQYVSQIEVIVRDDSYDNKTKEIVEEFQKLIPIQYFSGHREGLDNAILFLTQQARGEYVWWIGDDIILPKVIKKILTILNSKPSVIFLWINSFDIYNNNNLTVKDTRSFYFRDRNEILNIDIGLLGFITATIFKRDIGICGLKLAERYTGSAFVCLYIILYVIKQQGSYYYLGTPCFASHPKPPGEIRWYDQTQVFGINLFIISNEFSNDFDKKILKKALSKNLNMVLSAIVVERSMGLSTGFASKKPKIIPLLKFYWSYSTLYKFLLLLIMPTIVLKILYRCYKSAKQL